MVWKADEYLPKSAECEHKAQAASSIDPKAYYLALWRTLATIDGI
jgi:hypothetical protein